MAAIRIEGGVVAIGENLWRYDYTDNEGIHSLSFTGAQRPVLGDSVANGVLVPRTTTTDQLHGLPNTQPAPIINNDPGMQKPSCTDNTWPVQGRA